MALALAGEQPFFFDGRILIIFQVSTFVEHLRREYVIGARRGLSKNAP